MVERVAEVVHEANRAWDKGRGDPQGLPGTRPITRALARGQERWNVKTLTDLRASQANLTPHAATVADLVDLLVTSCSSTPTAAP
jgi:hypothetical protein